MAFRGGDPLDDFNRLDLAQSRWLARRPMCSVCGERIQDEQAIYIEEHWICEQCIKDHREWIDDED